MGSDRRGHRLGLRRQKIPVGFHVFVPVALYEGKVGVMPYLRQVECGRALVAVYHDDTGVRGDTPSFAPLLYVAHVMRAEAAAAEDDEKFLVSGFWFLVPWFLVSRS